MKFKGTATDFLIFGIFTVFLFYLVSLILLNTGNFATTGHLWGFSLVGLVKQGFLFPALFGTIISEIALMIWAKDVFFDTEKGGWGFEFSEKKKKGFSRYSNKKEMKKLLKSEIVASPNYQYAGVPIVYEKGSVWVDDGESHSLIIGTTGSGKTRRFVYQLATILGKKGESMILTDPKGEIYEHTAAFLKEQGYKIIVLNIRDPQNGNCWNPLAIPYKLYKEGNTDKSMELIDDLAANLVVDQDNKSDPFWERAGANYLSGLILALFEDATPEEINLNSINFMTTAGEERFERSTYIKDYFEGKDKAGAAYSSVSSTLIAPQETRDSILSVFKNKLKIFTSRDNVAEMLSHSDFDMNLIGKEKTVVYIIVHDEKTTYHTLVTAFIKQCYEALINVAQQSENHKLPIRTNFLLDEFANMPAIRDITTMITAARSREIRINLIIQNYAQLTQVYGKDNAETIRGNCGNILYLLSGELASLEEISKMCGEIQVIDKETKAKSTRPLITTTELQTLKMGDVIVMRQRMFPFKTFVPDYSQWKFFDKNYEAIPLPIREKQAIPIFNLCDFVKKQKEKKIQELLGENPGFNPFAGAPTGGNPGFNPFAGLSTGGTPGFNPFAGAPTGDNSMTRLPGAPSMNPMMGAGEPGNLNVDELVKRIDAKIAELEAEEAAEKAKLQDNTIQPLVIEKPTQALESTIQPQEELNQKPLVVEEPIKEMIEENSIEAVTELKPVAEIEVEESLDDFEEINKGYEKEKQKEVKVYEEIDKKYDDYDITDDQFFDDFFIDE